MRFIGDVHGKFEDYLAKAKAYKGETFQVGDMGLGFGPQLPKLSKRHKFIRGNHDNPELCKAHYNYAGDYGYWEESKLFFIGGAYSIDINFRLAYEKTHGRKIWWSDEELSLIELQEAFAMYKKKDPKVVVSHDCPTQVALHILDKLTPGFRPEKKVQTRTGDALDRMFRYHQPNTWIFGHYHLDQDFELGGTRFICLSELSYVDL